MIVAKSGSPRGWASAPSSIWPTATPISAPISVAAIAARERNSSVSSTIATPTPMSSPMGASCCDARSITWPRIATSTPPVSAVRAASSRALPSDVSRSVTSTA